MAEKISKQYLVRQASQRAYNYEMQYHGCSQAVLLAFQELLGFEDDLTFKAASPLAAGLGMGKTCGALAAGVMVIGIKYGRSRIDEGLEGLLAGTIPAQTLVRSFEHEFGTTSCFEIANVDWTDAEAAMRAIVNPDFLRKCAGVCSKTAEMVAEIIAEDS